MCAGYWVARNRSCFALTRPMASSSRWNGATSSTRTSSGKAEPSYLRSEGHRNTSISGDTRADWSAAFELVPSLTIAYCWHADQFTIEVGMGLRRIGFELAQMIIWDKGFPALGRNHYAYQHEPCWYARKKGSPPFTAKLMQPTIWAAAGEVLIANGG